jgi:hypothetical protein
MWLEDINKKFVICLIFIDVSDFRILFVLAVSFNVAVSVVTVTRCRLGLRYGIK